MTDPTHGPLQSPRERFETQAKELGHAINRAQYAVAGALEELHENRKGRKVSSTIRDAEYLIVLCREEEAAKKALDEFVQSVRAQDTRRRGFP